MKWSLRIITGIVAVLLIVAIVGILMIDGTTRTTIEAKASQALGVRTELEEASVKLVRGRLELHELDIANPDGFDDTPRFLGLEHALTDLSFWDLLRQRVEVEQLTLEGIDVNLEHQGSSSNYGTILENLKTFQGKGDPEPGKKFLVRQVVLRDITVNVRFFPIGGDATRTDLHIPEIVLEDVGTGDDALSTADLVGVVTTSILAAILHQGADVLPGEMVKGLGKKLGSLGDLGQFGMTVAGNGYKEVAELLDSVLEGFGNIGKIFRNNKDTE